MKKTKRTKERVIKIDTTEEKFFKEYLHIMRPFINNQIKGMMIRGEVNNITEGKKNIKNKAGMTSLSDGDQLAIYAMMLYYNDKFSDMTEEEKVTLINNYDIKMRIQQKVYGENKASQSNYFNNWKVGLRNTLCLVDIKSEGKKLINPLYEVYPEEKFRIVFEFNIKDRGKEIL